MSKFFNTTIKPAIRKLGVRVDWYRHKKRDGEAVPPDFDDLTVRVSEPANFSEPDRLYGPNRHQAVGSLID